MTWRNPIYMPQNVWRDGGTLSWSNQLSTHPWERVRDHMLRRQGKFDTAQVDNYVALDRGFVGYTPNYFIIANHDITGVLYYESSTNGLWSGEQVIRWAGTIDADPFEITDSMMTPTNDQHVRIRMGSSGAWSIGELSLSTRLKPTQGPDPAFIDQLVPNILKIETRSGVTYRLQLGAERRQMHYVYRHVSVANQAYFGTLLWACGGGTLPFWMWPTDDANGPYFVELEEPITREQAAANPMAIGEQYDTTVRMIEVLS